MQGSGRVRTLADLPPTLPIFPLPMAVVLPRGRLPLNIFEPRYLSMVDDALRTHRLIGMIQPQGQGADQPGLFPVGTAARIVEFAETGDGRYLITLLGIARFKVAEELKVMTPYRQVRGDFMPYAHDLREEEAPDLDRPRLAKALKAYLDGQRLAADPQMVERAPAESLINTLAMVCPFSATEKQALLEAPSLADRGRTLLTLLEMAAASRDRGPQSLQ